MSSDSQDPSVGAAQLCRLCGTENSSSFVDIFEESGLADKIRSTFLAVIYPDDSLSQYICTECHSDVTEFSEKVAKYQKIEKQWMNDLKAKNPTNLWLKATKLLKDQQKQTLAQIADIYNADPATSSEHPSMSNVSSESILKKILLNHHIYEVKSLQQICIDYFNVNGPVLLDTVLYVENPSTSPVPSEPESLQTQQTDEIRSVDLETADETSHTEDTRTEPETFVKVVKKKRSNPVRDYIKRRKRRTKAVNQSRGSLAPENAFVPECDSDTQDSFNVGTPSVRSTRSTGKTEQKPSRSSDRISKAPAILDASHMPKVVAPLTIKTIREPGEIKDKRIMVERSKSPPDVKPSFKKPTSSIEAQVTARPRKRSTNRINYSEALVDEALMYEEMLLHKKKKEQASYTTAIHQSKKLSLPEITIKPTTKAIRPGLPSFNVIRSPPKLANATLKQGFKPSWPIAQMANRECSIEQIPSTSLSSTKSVLKREIDEKPALSIIRPGDDSKYVSLIDIKNTLKINPESILKFNSSISITLKGGSTATKSSPPPPRKVNLPTSLDTPVVCKYCDIKFANMKKLAIHQIEHMRLETHRVGSKQILHPKLRRGRMVPVGNQKYFRCLNCWRLHPNSQSILEHWVSGKCLHYCSICGQSFHENPKQIREHFMVTHKIRYKVPDPEQTLAARRAVLASSQETPQKQAPNNSKPQSTEQRQQILGPPQSTGVKKITKISKSGRVTCEICKCSFPNMHSRNSHMRLHKNSSLAADLKQKGSKDSPFYQLEYRQAEPPNRVMHFRGKSNGSSHTHRQTQLKELLLQKPRPLNFAGGSQQRSQISRRPIASARGRSNNGDPDSSSNGSAVQIKSEPSTELDAETTFHDFLNAAMFSAETEYEDTDYSSLIAPTNETEIVGSPPISQVKAEPSDGPRIQIKKLQDLQGTSLGYDRPLLDPYYDGMNGNDPHPPHPQANLHHHHLPTHPHHQPLAPPPHPNHHQPGPSYMHAPPHDPTGNQSMQMHPSASHQMIGQSQQLQQFQISQVQQMQNAQYYNPVFVVQQPTQPPQHTQVSPQAAVHQQAMQTDMMYQQQQQQPYGTDPFNTDYSKFYS